MEKVIISAVIGLVAFVLIVIRNQWVYRHMMTLVGTGQPIEVFSVGYNWLMLRVWKWNFAKAIAEFKAKRLNQGHHDGAASAPSVDGVVGPKN